MAFDDATRNRLQSFVTKVRRILSEEISDQLRNVYGLDPDSGSIADIESLPTMAEGDKQTAIVLRELLTHYYANEAKPNKDTNAQLIDRVAREQSFTVLNRLCALRMAEARDLITESVGNGYQSKGFRVYSHLAGSALGETGNAYQCYLQSVFDELAIDLPALFDRYSEFGRLFPRESILQEVLEELNHQDLQHLWAEDETIGWIYQYFNSKEERKAMRDASQAPRNSRELAVRNQFFTPRYVVEFLTDNTLGRIWYEMRQGETRLVDECQYLVRRPNEIFLGEGEVVLGTVESEVDADLTQEELLSQVVHIPHRALKDPREIRMLDPACGSMHFGLYAFDLYLKIYEEYWDLVSADSSIMTEPTDLVAVTQTYESRDAFLSDVPRLIIEHNIHGIDIDPRAVQIAGLSLWLRAQRAWHSQGILVGDRPQVTRSNVVCAEPMPGDQQQLESFCSTLKPAIAQMVTAIFEAMKLAGEAGSLLKIEQEISSLVAAAKEQWDKQPKDKQIELFGGVHPPEEQQQEFDLSGITNEQFFEKAEEEIYQALRKFSSELAEAGFRRKLFANDAEEGFAFIELCQKRFSLALMNPPFGAAASRSKKYIDKTFGISNIDLGMAFVERFTSLLEPFGFVGSITSRAFLANETMSNWRARMLLGETATVKVLIDLGYGVLDDALVEAAAYVVQASKEAESPIVFTHFLNETEKENAFRKSFKSPIPEENNKTRVFLRKPVYFKNLPDKVMAYWLPESLIAAFDSIDSLEQQGGISRRGPDTGDDFRFLRLLWEIPGGEVGRYKRWLPYAKGGEYRPFFDDVFLCVDWENDGYRIVNFTDKNGKQKSRPQGREHLYKAGLTHPRRTTSDLSLRMMHQDMGFGGAGHGVFCRTQESNLGFLASCYTRPMKALIDGLVGSGDAAFPGSAAQLYRNGLVESLPNPLPTPNKLTLSRIKRSIALVAYESRGDETSYLFDSPFGYPTDAAYSLRQLASGIFIDRVNRLEELLDLNFKLDQHLSNQVFELDEFANALIEDIIGPHPCSYVDHTEQRIPEFWCMELRELQRLAINKFGARRQLTKKAYFADRKLELICHLLQVSPSHVCKELRNEHLVCSNEVYTSLCKSTFSWLIGLQFGRWRQRKKLETFDQFQEQLLSQDYTPSKAAWLTSDANSVQIIPEEELGVSIVSSHEAILNDAIKDFSKLEGELIAGLNVKSLMEYLATPANFFEYHYDLYSRSRRYAPIYWPISTESGSYTLWFYYHRLTDQTLYKAVNDFVDPKLKQTTRQLTDLRGIKDRTSSQEKELAQLTELESELKQFRDDLLEIAAFWRPNLNDGVQITAAPLHKFFRLKKWRDKLAKTWKELESGKYDWAHLALSIWPDRVVREKCIADRSIAIAHDLEEKLWEEVEEVTISKTGRESKKMVWKPRELSAVEISEVIEEVKSRD